MPHHQDLCELRTRMVREECQSDCCSQRPKALTMRFCMMACHMAGAGMLVHTAQVGVPTGTVTRDATSVLCALMDPMWTQQGIKSMLRHRSATGWRPC
mmetsp:Transcript_9033/g.25216  ORF Transcript_9033/g.25216 Transcript_9033/m.25216 type:complete len:98 (+) Transcript_9033:419-712(+)